MCVCVTICGAIGVRRVCVCGVCVWGGEGYPVCAGLPTLMVNQLKLTEMLRD